MPQKLLFAKDNVDTEVHTHLRGYVDTGSMAILFAIFPLMLLVLMVVFVWLVVVEKFLL